MEKWKWVPGYEGKYEVSNSGRVRSYAVKKSGTIISSNRLNADGYIHVSFRKDGIAKDFLLNRLVAKLFIGPAPKGKDTVNHINGVKTDNHVINLEWASRSDQMYHAYSHNLKKPVKPKSILSFTKEEKEYITKNFQKYKHGHSVNYFANKFGVHHSVIEEILAENKERVTTIESTQES